MKDLSFFLKTFLEEIDANTGRYSYTSIVGDQQLDY